MTQNTGTVPMNFDNVGEVNFIKHVNVRILLLVFITVLISII